MAQTDERELLETRDAILAVDEDERDFGTLIEVTNDLGGFYRHRMVEDPFLWPGLTDLTASVDFTAVAEAGVAAGFELAGYCSQAGFLFGNALHLGLNPRLRTCTILRSGSTIRGHSLDFRAGRARAIRVLDSVSDLALVHRL